MIRRTLPARGRFCFPLAVTFVTTLVAVSPIPGQTQPDLSWRQTETSIALLNHGRIVWQHVHDRKVGKPFMRIGLLDGTELTRPWPFTPDYPKSDHTWHRALWWSFKAIDGVNYWEAHQRGTDPVKATVMTNDDGAATIDLTIAYHVPDAPPVVMERRVISVSALEESGTYLIDWQATFTPAGEKGVVFNRNSYGGLAIRLAAEFCGDTDSGIPAWTFLDSEGRDNCNEKTARWVVYRGTAQNGQPAAVAIFDHPSNPRHPSPWQMRDHYPYLNPSFTCREDYTLPAGESLTLRYGVLVHSGGVDSQELNRRWTAFADRPVLKLR
jgi:hypothetical protein